MPNPYLIAQREKFDGLRKSIEGLQTRAAEENRDLSEDELRSVKEQGDQAKLLATSIEDLTDIENRSRKVAELAASLEGGDTQTRTSSSTSAVDRDPGHYAKGGEHGFFNDLYRSRADNDDTSMRRLIEHNRALTTAGAGAGIVPPKWLTDEYAALARQGRRIADAVRQFPLGNDPRPLTLPKQTTGADAVVPAEQVAENDVTPSADKFATSVDTVSPKPTRGKQIVSRQLLEMSSPAVDALIYGDLLAEYNRQVEMKVGAALITAAGAAIATLATEAAFTAVVAHDAVIDLGIAVRDARKEPATFLAMGTRRWGRFKKFKDPDGRPLLPTSSAGPVNVIGVGSVNSDGMIEDLPVIVTEGINAGAYPDSFIAFRSSDTLLFESDVMRFRYEERSGPESIELGIWAYTAVLVRYAGASVKRVQITAA